MKKKITYTQLELFENLELDDGYEDAPPEIAEAIRASRGQPNVSSTLFKDIEEASK